MKYSLFAFFTLFMLSTLSTFAQQTYNYKAKEMVNYENFKIVSDSSLKRIMKTNLIYNDAYGNHYNNEVTLRYVKDNDSIAYMAISITTTKGKKDIELPDSELWCYCQFEKTNNAMIDFDPEKKFFRVPLNNAIKTLIYQYFGKVIKKKIYIVILNNQSYDKYLMPKEEISVQDIILKWKILGEAKKCEYIYCYGVFDNGIMKLDRKDCLSFPHDNLLKGKITWRIE